MEKRRPGSNSSFSGSNNIGSSSMSASVAGGAAALHAADDFDISGHSDTSHLRPRARVRNIALPPPFRTTLAAVIMLVLGTIFLTIGLSFYFGGTGVADKGLSLIILGGIMFIPGSYASFVIYGAWRGWPGFDYSQIPSYDD